MTKKIAYVFLNGEFSKNLEFYKSLNIEKENLFCADGGVKKARELNIIPKEVWGDFDSLDEKDMEWLEENKVKLVKFEKEKDFTDGELLLEYLSSQEYEKIYILGGVGGRIDHMLTNINLLFKYPNLIFKEENEEFFRIFSGDILENLQGKTVSFIPFSDEVKDLTLIGFKYPLKNHILKRGDSTCISNIIFERKGKILFSSGKLICSINFKS